MSRKFLSFMLGLLVAVVVGCGGTDTVNLNSFNNATTTGLSGQTGAITLQTMLANNQIQGQEVVVVQSDIIPSFVDELRFTGQDVNGFFVWGPVVRPKAAQIELLNVPVEVTTLRIELLVNGFTVGGLVTPINVPSGEVVFLTDPTYVFAGAVSDVVDPTVVFGSFINDGSEGDELSFPEGEFPIEEAPVIDFSIPQVTNGVTRTAPGIYSVSEEGDYLLSYSLDIWFNLEYLLTQIARNDTFVDNTRLDLADLEEFPGRQIQGQEVTHHQGFQHIVTLQAGDTVSLRVREFFFIAGQGGLDVFGIPGGTFSIVRLGSGGVTGPAPPEGGID